MKIVSSLIVLTSLAIGASAQTKEGKIIYEQKIDLHRRIPAENAQMKAMIPPSRTVKFELYFGDNQSLYKAVEEDPDLSNENSGGVVMRFNGGAENEYYRNFSTKKAIEKRELMETIYLIDDSLRSQQWKLEDGETKTILGHTCKKATAKSERGSDVIAWYAEDIPVAAGPELFNGLPGLILGLDANKGEIVFTAVSLNNVDKKNIKAPTKGKKVNQAEFAKIQKELLGNTPGGVRIVTN